MRHFVQFHNPDVWGEALDLEDAFRVSTSKSVKRLMGQRMWLVSRTIRPRHYFVASTFIVDHLESDRRRTFPNTVSGREGQVMGPSARIDTASWWPELLAKTGSFLWGLTELTDERVVRGLERVMRSAGVSKAKSTMRQDTARRARFGDADSNRLVERAAIAFTSRTLKSQGWKVHSVEREARGYDLLCTKGHDRLDIEVKGIASDIPAFIITSNEVRVSRNDKRWRVAVVTRARSASPGFRLFTPSQFASRFDLEPKDYFAAQKRLNRLTGKWSRRARPSCAILSPRRAAHLQRYASKRL
jgi:hypothetical protein